MKLLSQLNKFDLAGKKVFLRVDFNVAVDGERITEPFKIEEAKPSIDFLLKHGAILTLASHIASISSFNPIRAQIMKILSAELNLLENTRSNSGEETNDDVFAKELARDHDIYVNDAFAVCHREHASVVGITKFLPSYAGLLVERETVELQKALEAPSDEKVVVLGGAKISTKMPVIQNFLDKSRYILLGGALINQHEDLQKIKNEKIILPEDSVPSGENAFDIGPRAIEKYSEIIRSAKLVVWNGPMGKFEDSEYLAGTKAVALAVADVAYSVIGGGDTVAAVRSLTPSAKFSYVSTGGGAMLEFLSGKKMPALDALGYYSDKPIT